MGNLHYNSPEPKPKQPQALSEYINICTLGPPDDQKITQKPEPKLKKKRHSSTRGDIPNG